ncbi:hypothetical protein ORQ98_07165 [Spartinivicinus sp. A2-2]|uniref:DUF3227 domain-containing protein n=2 Tax=Spartinivicinus poritis TaxID=2994640 RepID=A0ABT5U9B6_9GAMM|nr:hypothetical protein [Spartinivicinus sp. A2-2]
MKLYLNFMIKVLEKLDIGFPDELPNALQVASDFQHGNISEEEYSKILEKFWAYIDSRDAIRDFSSEAILSSRIGISLLSANKGLDEVDQKLFWFFELLDFLKIDLREPMSLMKRHFEFEK